MNERERIISTNADCSDAESESNITNKVGPTYLPANIIGVGKVERDNMYRIPKFETSDKWGLWKVELWGRKNGRVITKRVYVICEFGYKSTISQLLQDEDEETWIGGEIVHVKWEIRSSTMIEANALRIE